MRDPIPLLQRTNPDLEGATSPGVPTNGLVYPDEIRNGGTTPLKPKRIVLTERTEIVRDALCRLIENHFPEYILTPSASEDVFDDPAIDEVTLAICSMDEAHLSAAGRAEFLTDLSRRVTVLLIYPHDDPHISLNCLQRGVAGVFPSTESSELLIAAIRLLLLGGRFCTPSTISLSAKTG